MSILNDLYYGNLHPLENMEPGEKEYDSLVRKIEEESAYLASKLSDADRERFENYNHLVYRSKAMQNYANFEQGYHLGAMLIFESLTEKGNHALRMEDGEREESLLDVLAAESLTGALEHSLSGSRNYQDSLERRKAAYERMEKVKLNDEQEDAVDGLVSAVNYCGAVYGEAAYKQGVKDGVKLSAELKGAV